MNTASARLDWRTPAMVIVAGCLISMLGFGIRSSFGLFLDPMTIARGWDRETFALAMAIQNLLWGLGMPFAGAIADRFGTVKVIAFGSIIYALGVYGMSIAESGAMLHLTCGLLAGTGVAFTAFSLALAAIARVVSNERRSLALGVGTAAGSMGQVLFSPIAQASITRFGWEPTLVYFAAVALIMLPLAFLLPSGSTAPAPGQSKQGFGEALREAAGHRGYVLLTFGFFVCGFHVAFIAVHFPAYVKDIGLDPAVGAYAMSIVGLFNIAGSFLSGMAGQRWSKKTCLSVIYFLRAVVITALVLAPVSEFTIYAFACAMGILWLSTVPLTTSIVAQVFGVQYMATLSGIVFLSHQIGSFIGVWLGGVIYDLTGSYDMMWWAGVGLGLVAAIIHWPINEEPLPRLGRAATPAPA